MSILPCELPKVLILICSNKPVAFVMNCICYNTPMICKSSNYSLTECTFEELGKTNLNSFATLCAAADPLIKEGQQKRVNYLQRKLAQNLWGFVAYDVERHVAGFLDALPIEYAPQGVQGEDIYVIQCISVRDDMQGKGLGRQLMARAIERSQDRLGLAVIAYDDPEVKPAEFFVHVGFRELKQNGPVKLMWLPHKPAPEPQLSWRRNKNGKDDEAPGNSLKIELVTNDFCPYSYRTGKIISQLFAKAPDNIRLLLRRPEEKPLWRRLDIFPNLYINDQLKSIWALNEEEARTLLEGMIPKATETPPVKKHEGRRRGRGTRRNGERAQG
jgi:GNAT superfamily N-acetyltransferase